MSWPSDLYITLLTDLLSPGNLPRGTLASIAHHVGTLEDAGLSRLLSAMLQSPTLFGQDELQEASTSTHVSYLSPQATQDAFHAIRQGIVMRLQAAKKSKGSGWSKRRKLSKTLDTFYGVVSIPHSGKDWADSFKRSALVTGVLRGMQDAITEKDALITTDSSLIHTAERHVIKSLSNTVSLLPKVKATELPDDNQYITAWLIAQIIPETPSERLRHLASPAFLDFAFTYIRSCFMDGHVLDGMASDVAESSEGVTWDRDSVTSQRLSTIKQAPTHALLGRFSRSLGKVIEPVTSSHLFMLLLPQLERFESMAERIHRSWATCIWSNVAGLEDLHPNTRDRDETWTLFKMLLFTLTMIFSSLISFVNAMPTWIHSSPDKAIIELAACAIRTFSPMYFVTIKFGTSGFGAYQNVWYGAVDLISRAASGKVEQIVKTCEPRFEHSERRDAILSQVLPRSRLTYWLNLVEQLVQPLPQEYLSVIVVPTLRPYLTNKQDQEAFESAHSVMLAIFSKKKPISMELAKFYTDVLLQSYPDLLSISQLRLAFASMVTCLTDLESSEADRCILQLIHAIESLAPGPSRHQQAEVPLAEVGQSQQTAEAMSTKQENSLSATPLSAKALEAAAVGSRRGHLLLVLIDQLSTTTLAKMEGLLPIVQAFLHEEKRAPAQSRLALIQVLFNTLSGGMDMVKRESAAKWWLEHRSEIESGENDGASEGNYNATENDEKAGHVTSLVARL